MSRKILCAFEFVISVRQKEWDHLPKSNLAESLKVYFPILEYVWYMLTVGSPAKMKAVKSFKEEDSPSPDNWPEYVLGKPKL